MTTDPQTHRLPITRSVSYAVRGAPELPAHGAAIPGTTLAPNQVTFTYRAALDSQLGRIQARVKGFWRRDGSRVNPGQPMAQHYFGDLTDWPGWLAEEARLHDPDAVVPGPSATRAADRAAVLREGANALASVGPEDSLGSAMEAWNDAIATLRRMADEAQQQPDTETLAAALDGIHTLIATSSRDWGTYRVDAWLWAVLCGWDCEQAEHDDTCTHGAMEEMQQLHGWDAETVAKARRYRAAVRAITEASA